MREKKEAVDYMMYPPVINKDNLPKDHFVLRNNEIVDVRYATDADTEAIIAIQKECYDGNPPWGRFAVSNELNKPTSFFLIVHHLGLPISFIGLSLRHDTIHVTNIATIPTYQQHGLGTFLIEMSAELAKKLNRKQMTLEVRVSNEGAKRLYRKIGFQDGAIKKNYYHNNGEDALDMFLNLKKLDEYYEIQQIK